MQGAVLERAGRRLRVAEIAGEDGAGTVGADDDLAAFALGTGWPAPSSSSTVNQGIGRPTAPTTPSSLQVVMLDASVMP